MYLKKLIEREFNGMVKVITGIRRAGKSFLLFKLYKDYLTDKGIAANHLIEIALDGIEAEPLRDPLACYDFIKGQIKDKAPYYVFLDEVQFMPRFEEVLNSLLRIGNVDVYVTGSNSQFLLVDVITQFRGRGDEIRVYPLSFAEFYAATGGEYDRSFDEYLNYGGLPALVDMQDSQRKMDYLKKLFDSVYLKDVIERHHLRSHSEINTLVDILASSIGTYTNPTKIANTFKTQIKTTYTNKTIYAHLEHLEDAYLISRALRYDIKGRKYIGAKLKYYFTDVGLRNARLNFRQQEQPHLMENIVYNELLLRGYAVDVGVVEITQLSSDQKNIRKQLEVDFVCNKGSQRYYLQVAWAMPALQKQAQEFKSLNHIPDSFKKLVIVNGTAGPWRNDRGYVIMGMKYFLLNEDSLEF
ncbi:MAG: ATP-binding protein [Succinivibrio sp.]|nr:ATP-binding protein [Succinivibrio sp.]